MFGRVCVFVCCLFCCAVSWSNGQHFIYADVYTKDDGTVSGFVRWDDEEVLWTDHFNGQKTSNIGVPHLDQQDRDYLAQRMPERLTSWTEVARMLRKDNDYRDYSKPHDFIAQFGDIKTLTIKEDYRVDVTLRNGQTIELRGGSNDIHADVSIWPESGAEQTLDWSDLDKVIFRQAPEGVEPPFDGALFGTVETNTGSFTGQVQWDHDERVGIDQLDGDIEGREQSIQFSEITAIEKDGNGSLVTLKTGATNHMTGTNDVDSDNRGIIVTVPGTGRIDIGWKQFKRVVFLDPSKMASYSDFVRAEPILGQVRTLQGDQLTGRMVFNLDRAFDVEMLGGEAGELKYTVPFRAIKRVSPLDDVSAQVILKDGGGFALAYSNAVTDKNDGIIVFDEHGASSFVAWKSVDYIELR